MTQDSLGRLWIGTKDGLVCYDGIKYKNFQHKPFVLDSMHSSHVQCMCKDNRLSKNGGDVIWVGTYDGMERFDTFTETFTHYTVSDRVVCCFLRDSKNRLWIGTLNGLNILDETTGILRVFIQESRSSFIGNNTIRNLYEDNDGKIYACTYDGLYTFDEEKDSFVKSPMIKKSEVGYNEIIYNIFNDNGIYWISI